jgi:hypothetical protein
MIVVMSSVYLSIFFRRINHMAVKTICIHPLVYKKVMSGTSTYFSSMYYKSRYCEVRVHTKLELEYGLLK